jgi:hypothetical protein
LSQLPGAAVLLLYLPALAFAFVANRTFQRFFDLYRRQFGSHSLDDLHPQTREDWDARYAGRELLWLAHAPVLILRTLRLTSQCQDDLELEQIRRVGTRWAIAAIVSAFGGVIAMVLVVSPR